MLLFQGSPALSDFRLNKLLDKISSSVPVVSRLSAHFVHFVELSSSFDTNETEILNGLLEYGPVIEEKICEGELFLVTPRLGTISPWSSKATDIAHNCDLGKVVRLERGIAYTVGSMRGHFLADERKIIEQCVHDRMTEMVLHEYGDAARLFEHAKPAPGDVIDVIRGGADVLHTTNNELGLALSEGEIDYLGDYFMSIKRNPTDSELMMFAQANSEHCRHKIFNASWLIDDIKKNMSLFDMIRNTHDKNPEGVLSAYHDNSAVMASHTALRFVVDPSSKCYQYNGEHIAMLMKVETHNHPTAISPFAGAATGSGGEIRDEGATGRGSKPKVGLCGFSVSNLRIPGFEQPWENDFGKPDRIVSALDIMLEGPIGAAAFNNEFGRPNLTGYFRTFEEIVPSVEGEEIRGYHKPVMVAGGYGNIREEHINKLALPAGAPIVVLGGPAMLIGLGGGAASSMTSGTSAEKLDFASVQRGNPEMQRRCQEVIDSCWMQGNNNPVLSIHDVGAGGLSNALPELVHDGGSAARFEIREVNNDEPGMSPMQIWCNESQERYVIAIDPAKIDTFKSMCERERCPYAIVGRTTKDGQLRVHDKHFNGYMVDMPLDVLLGKPPKMLRTAETQKIQQKCFDISSVHLNEAAFNVLRLPVVASKSFLITIGDRSVTGMVSRDQMVGPWQIPVADVAVTTSSFEGYVGEAMSMGERAPVALLDGPASARMAIAEAITNIIAAPVTKLSDIKLSANWMAPAGHPGEDVKLYETVKAVGMDLCPQLGIAIPVGKDSMSMKTVWQDDDGEHAVTAPLSLIISAFSSVSDVRKVLTPQLRTNKGKTDLILIDLGNGKNRMGASALAQVCKQIGEVPPDLDNAEQLKSLFTAIQQLNDEDYLMAWHDRSDGGLFACLCEMAFAGHCGLDINIDELGENDLAALFNEELGGVIQVSRENLAHVKFILQENELDSCSHVIGSISTANDVAFKRENKVVFSSKLDELQKVWSETSFQMQSLRDNSVCARDEFESITFNDKGLSASLSFKPGANIVAPMVATGTRPRIAILREQGVNGQIEMAAAFDRSGFEAVDVHMSDIVKNKLNFRDFKGLVACGGFSYGDVLGAGEGWAKTILYNARVRDVFSDFFMRSDTFSLGVCNGCQMMANLKQLIPGADHWPHFVRNRSEQFEARFSLVEVLDSPSILLKDMVGSRMPIAVAHGEGRAEYKSTNQREQVNAALCFVDHEGDATEAYPFNPNGSPAGMTGFTTDDGRVTVMMPHPERVFRTVQNSWHPDDWKDNAPWIRLFQNARVWVD